MTDCLFCKIAAGQLGTEFLYEDGDVVVFKDIHPKAPVHILVVPKEHFKSLNELTPERAALGGKILVTAAKMAGELGMREGGYKVVINTGRDGGQVIDHFHLHVLGGQKLSGFSV